MVQNVERSAGRSIIKLAARIGDERKAFCMSLFARV